MRKRSYFSTLFPNFLSRFFTLRRFRINRECTLRFCGFWSFLFTPEESHKTLRRTQCHRQQLPADAHSPLLSSPVHYTSVRNFSVSLTTDRQLYPYFVAYLLLHLFRTGRTLGRHCSVFHCDARHEGCVRVKTLDEYTCLPYSVDTGLGEASGPDPTVPEMMIRETR